MILNVSNDYFEFCTIIKIYHDPIVCSNGYKLICVDEKYNKP